MILFKNNVNKITQTYGNNSDNLIPNQYFFIKTELFHNQYILSFCPLPLINYYGFRLNINLLTMSGQDPFNKNQSMNSTRHMTHNLSKRSNIVTENKTATPITLDYANIPMPKETPNWHQSAATWRHTSHKHSFSRNRRFSDPHCNYSDFISPKIPSSLSAKSCTFGRGTRKPISTVILRNAKQKPGPDRYDYSSLDENTRQVSKGKTFGLGWKHFQKNYIQHRADVYAQFQTIQNPTAQYQVRQKSGSAKTKFTMYERQKMYSQKMAESKHWVPGPYHKVNDRRLYATVGLNERNFSFGQRIDFSKPLNENPQAIYRIPGFCDRFLKTRHKNEKIITSRT